jgi:hypothetical protein
MENLKFDIVVFDLRKYNTVEDIQNIIDINDLNIDAKKLSDLSVKWGKVFIDKISSTVFAYIIKGSSEVTLSKESDDFLLQLKALSTVVKKENLSLDGILDKITEKGIESLTAYEKYFLKKNS